MLVDFDVWGQQGLIFSSEEALLRIKDSYFGWKQSLKLKMFSVSDKHTAFHFTRHCLTHWSHADCVLWIIVMFLSDV